MNKFFIVAIIVRATLWVLLGVHTMPELDEPLHRGEAIRTPTDYKYRGYARCAVTGQIAGRSNLRSRAKVGLAVD